MNTMSPEEIALLVNLIEKLVNSEGNWNSKRKAVWDACEMDANIALEEFISWWASE